MSFYSDASLVLIPSGYKNQKIYSAKPTDGSADLAFTRASDATRVASNGLIEKVRTNLLRYSEDLTNADWSKFTYSGGAVTVTGSQSDPFGGTNAQKLDITIGTGGVLVTQNITVDATSQYGLSVWLKGAVGGEKVEFDLRDTSSNGVAGPIQTLTTTWTRYTITLTNNGGTSRGFQFRITTLQGATDCTFFAYGAQLEAGVPTDYIATTTTAVSVGPVSGLPRLDYLNSTCPRLLLEPSRTNLVTFSEQLDNAAWSKTQATVTANQAVSPDGYTNADLLVDNSNLSGHVTQQTTISVPSSQAITISGYYKDKDIRYAGLRLFVPTNGTDVGRFSIVVDLQTGAITSTLASGATIANLSYNVTSVGNGWYRLRITGTSPAGNAGIMAWLSPSATPTNDGFATASYSGTGKGCYLYGFQAELGAYVTSYIPTLGTSVTRVTDAAYKGSISSLIGQTEGVAYIDFVWNGLTGIGSYPRIIELWGDSNNYIQLFTVSGIADIYWDLYVGGVTQASGSTSMALGRNKIAVAYKGNDFALYKNGTLIASDTNCTIPATSSLGVAGSYAGSGAQLAASVSQFLLFKTRLTNAQLLALTSL